MTVVHTNTNYGNEHVVSNINSPTEIGAFATDNTKCLAPTNFHPMITRAKVGTIKPKIYTIVSTIPSLPSSVKEAIASPVWSQAMTDEYLTLLKNKT